MPYTGVIARVYIYTVNESVEFGVEVAGKRETSKVCLVNGEHQLTIGWCQLCWLECEIVIKVAGICGIFLSEENYTTIISLIQVAENKLPF